MQFETRALKEFTRIFPPEKKAVDRAFSEEYEVEEEEGSTCFLSFLFFICSSFSSISLNFIRSLLFESSVPIFHLHGSAWEIKSA